MKRIFVSGAMTPTSKGNHAVEFLENVRYGILMTTELIKCGFAVYCPFTDFLYWLCDTGITLEMIYKMDKEMLKVMDAVLLLPGSEKSVGSKEEVKYAKSLGIPIFSSIVELEDYFSEATQKSV